MTAGRIDIDHEVFAAEGQPPFGAVREVHPDHLVVWIENRGDSRIDAEHVVSVHDGKVIVDVGSLPEELRAAIEHAHDAESPARDPTFSDEESDD